MSTLLGLNTGSALSSVTTIYLTDTTNLAILVTANTTAETQANIYQKGCICIRTDSGAWYSNTGTSASPSWTLNGTGTGTTGTTGTTGVTGPTGPTGPTA